MKTSARRSASWALLSPERPENGRAECLDRRSGRNGRALYRWYPSSVVQATQFASASASATVIIASTSTASCSPKIKVDVIGSKPSASPKGLGRSPTMVFPGAVKTFTLSVFDVTGALTCVVSFTPFVPSILYPFDVRASDCSRQHWQQADVVSIGRTYQSIPKYWLVVTVEGEEICGRQNHIVAQYPRWKAREEPERVWTSVRGPVVSFRHPSKQLAM